MHLLEATFASAKDNAAPKSAYDAAAAEIKMFTEETPLPLPENPLSGWEEHRLQCLQLPR